MDLHPGKKAADTDVLSLADLCRELSVSTATGRNWIRLGKLTPTCVVRRSPFFSREYADSVINDIKLGKTAVLKSRRNKKFVSGHSLYHSYVPEPSENLRMAQMLISEVENTGLALNEDLLRVIIGMYAVQLISEKTGAADTAEYPEAYLRGELPASGYWYLADALIRDRTAAVRLIREYPELFRHTFVYDPSEDTLGLLYISLLNIGKRKATGSYYTPAHVALRMCSRLFDMNSPEGKTIFDPCCGTGNFLLQLPSGIGYEQVYGNDTDPLSVQIARINYALKYEVYDPETVCSHITERDYLSFDRVRRYDFILGNPPWGREFTGPQKDVLKKKYSSAGSSRPESCDLFIEQALSNLNENGSLSFILPEAVLSVKTHAPIRKIMLNCCRFQYLEYLGNAFDGVQCPCVILQMIHHPQGFQSTGTTVNDGRHEYTVTSDRNVSAECIRLFMTDEEYGILRKMELPENKTTLRGKAGFALGIVTGNNRKYITSANTPGTEMILKGSDLCRFRFRPSGSFIRFTPDSFQQTAPAELYRAPEKLLYRFISSQPVFAYDDRQTLSLNSCNILIPRIPGLDMKYVMAVLNSRCALFYFRKQYRSVKVLRSHIESFPIPVPSKEQQQAVLSLVHAIMGSADITERKALYDRLDETIAGLYCLSPDEYCLLRASAEGENLLLSF